MLNVTISGGTERIKLGSRDNCPGIRIGNRMNVNASTFRDSLGRVLRTFKTSRVTMNHDMHEYLFNKITPLLCFHSNFRIPFYNLFYALVNDLSETRYFVEYIMLCLLFQIGGCPVLSGFRATSFPGALCLFAMTMETLGTRLVFENLSFW